MTEHIPPHDLDAEGAVISAVLSSPIAIGEAREILTASDFYSDANRRVFDAACSIDDAGGAVDVPSVASVLHDAGRLQQVGGSAYLLQLLEATPAARLDQQCERVATKARTRRIITAALTIAAQGYGDAGTEPGFSERAEQLMFDAAETRVQRWPTEQMGALVMKTFRAAEEREARQSQESEGIRAPWAQLRSYYRGGIELSAMHVIAARPGMGKSVYCSELCRLCACPDCGALIISLEMPSEQIAHRIIAAESRVPSETIRFGEPSIDEWSVLTDAGNRLTQLPLSVTYRPGATMAAIRAIVRRETARQRDELGVPLRLVVVDYLQLVRATTRQSREVEVSDISRELTYLAGETGVALIAVSQLNRGVEQRSDKRPLMSDLRESGAIEQDATSIQFLFRDEYYTRENSKEPGLCEVDVAKHRNGKTGTARLHFNGAISRFDDIASEYDDIDDIHDRVAPQADSDDEPQGWWER